MHSKRAGDAPAARGRRVVVTGANHIARDIAEGLAELGARVILLAADEPTAPPVPAADGPDRVECRFASEAEVTSAIDAADELLRGIDQVVHCWTPPPLLERSDFVDLDETEWAAGAKRQPRCRVVAGTRTAPRHCGRPRARSCSSFPPSGCRERPSYAMLAAVVRGAAACWPRACGRQWGVGPASP